MSPPSPASSTQPLATKRVQDWQGSWYSKGTTPLLWAAASGSGGVVGALLGHPGCTPELVLAGNEVGCVRVS